MASVPKMLAIVVFAANPTAKPVIPKPAINDDTEYPWFCKNAASIIKKTTDLIILEKIGKIFTI